MKSESQTNQQFKLLPCCYGMVWNSLASISKKLRDWTVGKGWNGVINSQMPKQHHFLCLLWLFCFIYRFSNLSCGIIIHQNRERFNYNPKRITFIMSPTAFLWWAPTFSTLLKCFQRCGHFRGEIGITRKFSSIPKWPKSSFFLWFIANGIGPTKSMLSGTCVIIPECIFNMLSFSILLVKKLTLKGPNFSSNAIFYPLPTTKSVFF